MCNSYGELSAILHNLNFIAYYNDNIHNRNFVVNYGKAVGEREFNGVAAAAAGYAYNAPLHQVNINHQADVLNNGNIDDCDVVLKCIEIFDWGKVQNSNIINALNLYREKQLTPYLKFCKEWFECDDTLEVHIPKNVHIPDVLWSSGWTKVYSFMFNETTIYDSRVAAFINYIMVGFYLTLEEEQQNLLISITSKLLSFTGPNNRARYVNGIYRNRLGIGGGGVNANRKFQANKVASWILRYISNPDPDPGIGFREIDKAAFMLGFDMSQLQLEGENIF